MIPPWWIWYYWICPLSWVFSGLANSQFCDISTQIVISGTGGQTKALNQYLKDYYGIEQSFLKFNAIGILGWTLFFAVIFCLAIKKLNFQRR